MIGEKIGPCLHSREKLEIFSLYIKNICVTNFVRGVTKNRFFVREVDFPRGDPISINK